jgi:hypothetical protein
MKEGLIVMSSIAQTPQKHSPAIGAVVPAFNGEAERFVLRAFRLFRRTLVQANGDAGKVLTKHLRTRLPPEAVNRVLGDLAAMLLEIHFLEAPHVGARATAKWSSKHEFFVLALLDACQRRDKARASEAAIALLDTFEVGHVMEAATQFAQRLEDFDLHLMPIGEAAFSYFADYQPVEEPFADPIARALVSDAPLLRVI